MRPAQAGKLPPRCPQRLWNPGARVITAAESVLPMPDCRHQMGKGVTTRG
jgi:hypothetical protein